MAGLYDLMPQGALNALGLQANTNDAAGAMNVSGSVPQMNQAAGILNQQPQFDWGDALAGVGRGLVIAGSPNPGATYMEFARADKDNRDANKPKVTPLADGAFSLVTYPDGSTKVMKNEDVASFLKEQETNKMANALAKIGYQGVVTQANQAANVDNKGAGEARQQLAGTQALYDGWKKALGIVTEQASTNPTMAKVQGAMPGISGFFGGDQVAANKFLQQLTVDETLLNTARTKGAISDAEMTLFKSPIPSLSDDREKVWKPYIEQRLPVIEKLMQFQQAEAARGDKGPGANIPAPGGKTPAAAPQAMTEAQVKATGVSYDPGYEYAMVNGQLMKRKKGN